MGKTAGIIVEFNPLHNGHIAHLCETRRITGCKFIITVMSGNFVQRGEPALCDKWRRTNMALLAGVDVVIELPVPYVLAGADYFARAGVGLLAATGVVDCLSFGSESGDIDAIKKGGEILAHEPPIYKEAMRSALDKGNSFASARGAGLKAALGALCDERLTSKPNNGLGMEYCKALALLDWPMEAHTTHRKPNGASATAIRRSFHVSDQKNTTNHMPDFAHDILCEARARGETVRLDDFSAAVRYMLCTKSFSHEEGLENRFRRLVFQHPLLSDLLAAVKTKRYTLTHLQRAAMRILLGITPGDMRDYEAAGGPCYIRVLGFRKESAHLISEMTRRAQLPVLTHGAAMDAVLAHSGAPANMLAKEWEAGDVYRLAYRENPARTKVRGFRGERATEMVRV